MQPICVSCVTVISPDPAIALDMNTEMFSTEVVYIGLYEHGGGRVQTPE